MLAQGILAVALLAAVEALWVQRSRAYITLSAVAMLAASALAFSVGLDLLALTVMLAYTAVYTVLAACRSWWGQSPRPSATLISSSVAMAFVSSTRLSSRSSVAAPASPIRLWQCPEKYRSRLTVNFGPTVHALVSRVYWAESALLSLYLTLAFMAASTVLAA